MKPKTARVTTTLMCLSTAIMITAMASQPAESAAPPAAAVKKDNTPVPASGVLSITFLGNKKFTDEQLQKVIAGTELKIGGENGSDIIGPAMKALVDLYEGKLSVAVNIIDDDRGVAFIQFVIDENATGGDLTGLRSGGGPYKLFCQSAATAGSNGGAPPAGGGMAAGGMAPGGMGGDGMGGGGMGGGAAPVAKKDTTPLPSSGVVLIKFLGNKKITTEQLQKVVDGSQLKLGEPVNATVVASVTNSLVNLYKENGLNLNISPNIVDDPKGITAVQFIIEEEGTKGNVGEFVSSGGPHIFCAK